MLSWLVFVLPSWSLHFLNGSHCTDAIFTILMSLCCECTPGFLEVFNRPVLREDRYNAQFCVSKKKKKSIFWSICRVFCPAIVRPSVCTAEWRRDGDLNIQCRTDKTVIVQYSLNEEEKFDSFHLIEVEAERWATATKAERLSVWEVVQSQNNNSLVCLVSVYNSSRLHFSLA